MQRVYIVRRNPSHHCHGWPDYTLEDTEFLAVYATQALADEACEGYNADHFEDDCVEAAEDCLDLPYIVTEHIVEGG